MARFPGDLARCTGFEWDAGNRDKNWERHGVLAIECERVFFQRPLWIAPDAAHSQEEPRHAALGRTVAGRLLAVVFTVRGDRIRVISARPMSRAERRVYERAPEKKQEEEEAGEPPEAAAGVPL